MNKLDELKKLREEANIKINYEIDKLNDGPNIYIANHNCLMDIFYLPSCLDHNIGNLISARLCYKKDEERLKVVNKFLYSLPIEAHGGKDIANICKYYASRLLQNNIDIAMFPEGAYLGDNIIYRGRTGATQILFKYIELTAKKANLIPVAIDIRNKKSDLDCYYHDKDSEVEYAFYKYNKANDLKVKNSCVHAPIDSAMQSIASRLNREYVNNYIELRPKGNVIFENGETIDTDKLTQDDINRYDKELEKRTNRLVLKLRK